MGYFINVEKRDRLLNTVELVGVYKQRELIRRSVPSISPVRFESLFSFFVCIVCLVGAILFPIVFFKFILLLYSVFELYRSYENTKEWIGRKKHIKKVTKEIRREMEDIVIKEENRKENDSLRESYLKKSYL